MYQKFLTPHTSSDNMEWDFFIDHDPSGNQLVPSYQGYQGYQGYQIKHNNGWLVLCFILLVMFIIIHGTSFMRYLYSL